MNHSIYKNYCDKIIDLCSFAVNKHSELIKSDNSENLTNELKKNKNFVDEFLNERKSIYLLGESSSGKSTFLNHIFENKIIPQSTKIETRVISKTHDSDKMQISVTFKNNIDSLNIKNELKERILQNKILENQIILDINKEDHISIYEKLVKSSNDTKSKNDAGDFISEVNIYYPFRYFRNFVFYDTPGINSAKDDTDDLVVKTMFSKFSSYVFFLFDASEPAQSQLKKHLNENKDKLKEVSNNRIIFLGTHMDGLEKNFKGESNIKSLIKKYKEDLKIFIDNLGIQYLDIFLINLSPSESNLTFSPLDLKNKVIIGEIEHKINMHSYELDNYFLNLVVNYPEKFIQDNIIDSFNKRLSVICQNKNFTKNKIKEDTRKYSKELSEINEATTKPYFKDYIIELENKIQKLLTAERGQFNDKVVKIENFINKFKSDIDAKIDDDFGGKNCNYKKIKVKLKSQIHNYKINLDDYKFNSFISFKFLKTKKTPFLKGVNSDVFKGFKTHHANTKKHCLKIIKDHYDNIKTKYEIDYKIKIQKLENDLNSYNSEYEVVNKIITEIKQKEVECIKTIKGINERIKERVNEKQSNPFFRFLNDYRNFKQIKN